MAEDPTGIVSIGIAAISLLAAGAFLLAVHAHARAQFPKVALLMLAWLGLFAWLALSGVLARFDRVPPPVAIMMVASLACGIALGLSRLIGMLTHAVPLWALVAFQGFRLPLELVMHEAAGRGIMPPELSFAGYNFDIVTGASALLVAFALRRGAPTWLALLWSLYGSYCLVAIAIIAVASSPMVRAFGPTHVNTWVAYFPYVWLPTVLVVLAIAGHFAVFRKLRSAPGPG